ncbi:Anaphase-promoting complex subunit 2 [Mycena indigotica]|uniref:Anaphase-promoting complex subunit 2 n=1 Tax=Mycena indigotica TaxID=2126181 RepID=A0A8H6S461_9AGAR|nr:Anaphase-promoting complex subunit 2 [Mycena indigotica]KAF7291998.1 Anaphase-promoting complex subunit 2 [Mycena indigotica]
MATAALRSQVQAKWNEGFTRLNRTEPGISGLMSYTEAWNVAQEYLRPRNIGVANSIQGASPETTHGEPELDESVDISQVKTAFDLINRSRRLPVMLEVFLDAVADNFHMVVVDIQRYLAQYQVDRDPETILQLVFRLVEWYRTWAPIEELGPTIRTAYTLTFQTRLFSALPAEFLGGFKALCASSLVKPSPHTAQMWASFETLGMADRYEGIVATVGYERIEHYIHETYAKKWDGQILPDLRKWMSTNIVPWMLPMYAKGASSTDDARSMLANVGARFDFHMNKTLCDLRTSEIFDIIVDYPDSEGALKDLRECLQRVDQRATLVQALRRANHKRLLHPGADTKIILQQYVATIKCLRIVDPPGVLLFKVADPIRRYLRERPDTIRSIVANLVGDDDGGDSLVDENDQPVPLQQQDADNFNDPNWDPEPVDAGPEFRTNKPSDVISTLVSIYDSKDLFVKELQVLLAQRLLAIKEEDNTAKVDKERRTIEILKIRFGEAAMQVCEVMLKDMSDSKRIDTHIQSQKPSIVHPTIISRNFWPALESSDIIMPGQFQELQKAYAKEYTVSKPDKKLRWLPHLGTVHLELELRDRKVDVDVPPLEAAFIELFSQKNVWTMEELIAGVGSVDRTAALKALITWIDLGVLKEDQENVFRLLEVEEESGPAPSRSVPMAVEEPALTAAQQQHADQMRLYWNFIEGMLTNLGPMSLDKIQSMLRLAPNYDQSIDQLAGFMAAASRSGRVTSKDGLWMLNA